MADYRVSQEDIHRFASEVEITSRTLDKNGLDTNDEKFVARTTHNSKTDVNRFYILAYGNILYDVQNYEPLYHKRHTWKLTAVNENAFDLYVKFLQTKRRRFLALAERALQHG